MKYISLLLLFCFSLGISIISNAQELSATVRVLSPNISTSDKSVIQQLEKSISEFFNNQKFTTDNYEANERIKCNFLITIASDLGNNNFLGDITVQASRPVYSSNYESTLINLSDKNVPFRFDPFRALENSKETYFDNLSSVLTYYAYLILYYDFQSFSAEGGESTLFLLRNMVNSMPPAAKGLDDGWKGGSGSKNTSRYDLMENLTNSRMNLFGKALYDYHRMGLDLMYSDPAKGRRNILSAIESLFYADNSYPNSYLIHLFCVTKGQEILKIFRESSTDEKKKIYQYMTKIDPANTLLYSPLKL